MAILHLLTMMAAIVAGQGATTARPNVVVIYLDDMGYGDPGCYGGKLAPTPHIDSLATNGARFTDGYVTACVCGPSRLALLTGRHQCRTGHDGNFGRPGTEPSLSDKTIADYLKATGYATAVVGKWHLGEEKQYLPASRGFEFSVGSLGNLGEGGDKTGFYRGLERLQELPGTPITSPVYAEEAVRFIDAQKERPFFLYLAFNAVHNPNVASEHVLQRFPNLRRGELNYAASISEADDAIGKVLGRVRERGLEERTLIFCISDNGDSSPFANTAGLRGHKWTLWEGGIREPWLVQWKGRIPAGRVLNQPVVQLDVLPTILAAVGVPLPDASAIDGVNLLPLLEGSKSDVAREALYWRFGPQFAVRQGDLKLVKAAKDAEPMLIDLAKDPGETSDLSAQMPERKRQLQTLWDSWNAQMKPPTRTDRRWDGEEFRKARKQQQKNKPKK